MKSTLDRHAHKKDKAQGLTLKRLVSQNKRSNEKEE